jgi:hypothetical protein
VAVRAFVLDDASGLTTVANRDAQGMRATESHDTVLDAFPHETVGKPLLVVDADGPP